MTVNHISQFAILSFLMQIQSIPDVVQNTKNWQWTLSENV